jgi:hypothetical protein
MVSGVDFEVRMYIRSHEAFQVGIIASHHSYLLQSYRSGTQSSQNTVRNQRNILRPLARNTLATNRQSHEHRGPISTST